MKFNRILVALLIVGMLSCGLSAVFAEDGTLPDGTTVAIPDGYSVLANENGLFTLVTEDQKNVIAVLTNDEPTNVEEAKKGQMESGAEFIDDKTVKIGDTDVVVQHFSKDGFNLYGNIFSVGNKNYVVTYTSPDEVDVSDASTPVNQVITSLIGSAGTSE